MKHETTIKTLKQLGVDYCTLDGDKLTINGSLHLGSLTTVDKDFLAGTTINGSLFLGSLTTVDKDFLAGTIINGSLYFGSLTTVDKDFLAGTTINGSLHLRSLTTADKDFLAGTTINVYLHLGSLTTVDKDFLAGTTINGSLDLGSLTTVDKDFLAGTTINGSLDLRSLTTADKDFLAGTTINGSLDLRSLTTADKDFLAGTTINGSLHLGSLEDNYESVKNNPSELQEGYNEKGKYCFFDGILSKVLKVSEKNGFTIYKSPFEYVVQKGDLTAHSKTIKQGMIDVNFKAYVTGLKHSKIKMDDEVSVNLYRAITGACYGGIESWMRANDIPIKIKDGIPHLAKKMKVKDVYDVLEKTSAYGFERFKELVNK
jgi:hypothetical protein